MKKFFTVIMATAALTFGFNTGATAQVEQGNMIVDLYYGFPNFGKTLWKVLEDDSSNANTKATGIGPLGGRFEYMIADNLGFGVDINYLSNGFEYDYTSSVYDTTTSTFVNQTYHVTYTKQKLRIMARLNYHFVQTDVVDAYVGFGAGYKHKINKFTSTNPNDSESELEAGLNLVPVSIRICLGTRFFFTENIGINMELGAGGGPLLSGGLSLKF